MSINSVNLTGRLTRDPDVRYTDGGTSITIKKESWQRKSLWKSLSRRML